ncbi:MAG: hypothetical protein NTY19_32670 [Planctomycetota bacterium]|nr:hypothetical protein [Planctomycetota bacterium]
MVDDAKVRAQAAPHEVTAADVRSHAAAQLQTAALAGAAVALLAGLATWGMLQATGPVFAIPPELANLPTPAPSDKLAELDRALAIASRNNATYALGLLGLLLGAFLATAEAVSRRTVRTAIPKGLLAGVTGGLAGAVAGFVGSQAFGYLLYFPHLSPLGKTIVIQIGALGLLGSGVGLGLGLPYARPRLLANCILGAVLGGTLAAVIYPAVVGYLLPVADTEMVVPGVRGGQLPWVLLTAGLIGLVATGLGKPRKPHVNKASGRK